VLHAIRATAALDGIALDIVHDHTRTGLLTASARRAPTVATVHAPVAGPRSEGEIFAALEQFARIPLVALSASQRRGAPDLNWIATVHNGIRVEEYPFVAAKEDFVLFLGRTSDEKGVHVAIDAARAAGRRLVIAGSWTIPSEQEYFERHVRPQLGSEVEWVGEVHADEKKDLLGRAACVVFPALWEEPFGLVIVEALACGTPVAGLRAGAVPELLDDRTGAIADDAAGLADAIRRAVDLDAGACRARAESRFSTEAMVRAYEAVYERVLAGASGDPLP
jgi:glycosyltransferase involved in cell wall biosynthesis